MKKQLTVGIYLSILNFAKTADQGLIISSVNGLKPLTSFYLKSTNLVHNESNGGGGQRNV